MQFLLSRPWRMRFAAVVLALLAWLLIAVPAGTVLRQVDEQSSDLAWRIGASDSVERRVVIVDIDDASLQRIGPWPWPRETQAKLVRALREQGAGLQLYDVVFPDNRQGGAELAAALAQSRPDSPAVLAQVFGLGADARQRTGELTGALPGQACSPAAVRAHGYVANAAELGAPAGHITPRLDSDGAVRRMPAIVCFGDRNYPALSLAGLIALEGSSGAVPLKAEPGKSIWDPAWTISLPGMPGITMPLDRNGDVRIPWHKTRESFVSIPAADVLEGKADAALLRGAWVLVGGSAFGLGDTVATSLGAAASGVEVHAQLLTGLLDGKVPVEPAIAPWLSALWAAAGIGLLLVLSSTRGFAPAERRSAMRSLWLPFAGVALALAGYALHAAVLVGMETWLGWAHAGLAIVLAGLVLGAAEHARSLAERGRLFRNLASYLPRPVAEKIAQQEPSGLIVADRRDVTVVMADVRNFSAYCEARSPEDAARVLHRFYTTASEIMQSHGGVVEEVVGDSLIAVFNGSQPCDNHPVKALAAAREVWLRCSEELPNVPPQGLEPLGLGVGVESGTALLGSFGPSDRRVHSVLGQTVTVAIRLCDLSAELAYPVLVGAETAERVGVPFDQSDLALKPLGSFLLSGLRQSSKVFTLRALMQPGSDVEQQSLRYLRDQTAA